MNSRALEEWHLDLADLIGFQLPGSHSEYSESTPEHARTFEIRHSRQDDVAETGISPDLHVCRACLHELFNPPIAAGAIRDTLIKKASTRFKQTEAF